MTADSLDGPEFLIALAITAPPGTRAAVADDAMAREALHARELAGQGHLLRLWALPGRPVADAPSDCGERATLPRWPQSLRLCRCTHGWTWTPRRSRCTPTTRHFSKVIRTLEPSIDWQVCGA
jgi:hypothetical protein